MPVKLKIIICLLLIHFQLTAQDQGKLKGFYGSTNLGIGIISGNISGENTKTTGQFAMHFTVGFFVCRSAQVGITFNGFLFESYGLIPFGYKGESISNGMIHLQVYPVKNYRLFIKGAYGISEYSNLRPDGDSGKGRAFMAALGYEQETGLRRLLWGIQLSYNSGNLKYNVLPGNNSISDRRFRAMDLTLFLALD
jgi:hypothetical protein